MSASGLWEGVRSAYRQYSELLDQESTPLLPDVLVELKALLAEKLKRLLSAYPGREMAFADEFLSLISEVDGITGNREGQMRHFYIEPRQANLGDMMVIGGRRNPSIYESVFETCRRLFRLNELVDRIRDSCVCVVLGGSLSYGKFFNVRGTRFEVGGDSSDVDLLIVVEDLHPQVGALSKRVADIEWLDETERVTFSRRVRQCRSQHDRCDMVSQKITVGERDNPFAFSMHITARETFLRVAVADGKYDDLRVLGEDNRDISEHLWDFRAGKAQKEDYFQRSFDGRVLTKKRQQSAVPGGVLSRVPIFHIEQGRFYPGLHQNIVLPEIEIRHENPTNAYRLPMLAFKYQVLERLRREQQLRPSELLVYSYCHSRGSNLSPYVRRNMEVERI